MVAQATLLLFGSFFVMLLAGVPISAGIGIASIFTALFSMDPAIFALTAAQRCFSGIDSFSLLALPFLSLGGNIMNKGGIAKRLVRLARLAVGKMPGYLAATNVLANMFFGAVSGSSVAATSAMGSIMAPLELDEGYDPNYSAAVNICSAPTGILIPPSGPLILYSITAGGVSVAALFMGGYLPGILMGLCVAGLAVFIAVKKGYKSSDVKDPDPAVKIIIDAVPSLLAVIIVMGGILAGFFTATEAGVVLCLYCGLLSILYKEMTFKSFYNLLADPMESSATILFLIAASSIMCSHPKSYDFIDRLWEADHKPDADGYFDAYYDGLLRLFAFMHLSGHYRVGGSGEGSHKSDGMAQFRLVTAGWEYLLRQCAIGVVLVGICVYSL